MAATARDTDRLFELVVPAAKLHVLNLEPIKQRLADKWPRLSGLVHALFEKALKRAQGPMDGFIGVGELAYIATFHGRTAEQAALMCASIAKEVCELLFGDGAGDIAVRSVVGLVPASQLNEPIDVNALDDTLEWVGQEGLVTKTSQPEPTEEMLTLGKVAALPKKKTYPAALFPIWDLQKRTSSFMAVSPVGKGAMRCSNYRRLDPAASDQTIADLELALLQKAGAYALRVQRASKVCAVTAGVSWESLCANPIRNRYVAVMKEIPAALNCPLLVKIDDVPAGIQLSRLVEIVAALNAGGARVLVDFASDIRIPDLDMKLGAAGIGTTLPDGCSVEKGREIIAMLKRRVGRQSAFSFIGGLENRGLLEMASESKIKFGMGSALGGEITSLESIPDFPLHIQPSSAALAAASSPLPSTRRAR